MRTLALDIGGTKCTAGAFEGDRLVMRETKPTDRAHGPAAVVSTFAAIASRWREQGFVPERCGIGFGGPVDFPSQSVTLSTHVAGWDAFPLVDQIREVAQVDRVRIDNDANVGAFGEYHFGAGRGADPLFYMTLSTGIGGGIIWNGRLLRGADSYAGELGHMTLDPDGPLCLCGARGCLERLACGLWLERDYGKPAILLVEDPEFVWQYVSVLARGLKTVVMLLNPARVVIGGGISKAGAKLFDPLRAELRRQVTAWSRARLDVQPAALGDDSVLYGALRLAREEP